MTGRASYRSSLLLTLNTHSMTTESTYRRWFDGIRDTQSRGAVLFSDQQICIQPRNPLSNLGSSSFLMLSRKYQFKITTTSATPLRKKSLWTIGIISIRLLNCKSMANTQGLNYLLKAQDEVNLQSTVRITMNGYTEYFEAGW